MLQLDGQEQQVLQAAVQQADVIALEAAQAPQANGNGQ